MPGLRDLIEGKRRRTARHPIQVGDQRAAAAEMAALQERAKTATDPAEQEKLRAEAKAVLDAQTAWVELQSLPEDEWDEIVGDLEPDEKGHPDIGPLLAPLAAASCTDPELQDAEWWSQQLKRPEWTSGDKGALAAKLLQLNIYAPSGIPGKG